MEDTPSDPPKEGIKSKLMRLLSRKSQALPPVASEPNISGQELAQYTEGEVPLLEVARLINQHGEKIAENIWKEYGNRFLHLPKFDVGFEDPENKIQFVPRERGGLGVNVFFAPPDAKESGYALSKYPKVLFIYGYPGEKVKASIHGPGGVGYMDVSLKPEQHPDAGAYFWRRRTKMADVERALGKFLNPSLNPSDTKS